MSIVTMNRYKRKELILGYVMKNDEKKKNPGTNGLNARNLVKIENPSFYLNELGHFSIFSRSWVNCSL